jgi:hypothetical protein
LFEDSPPEDDGEEPGGDDGIPDPLVPRISVSARLVVFLVSTMFLGIPVL